MTQISSDDDNVKKLLEKLVKKLTDNGAYFHSHLKIVYRNGEFSTHRTAPVENDTKLVLIPHSCLLRPSQFSYTAQNGKIIINAANDDTPALEKELMELVIDIYNASGKLDQYKKNSVYSLYYEAPDLYRALTYKYHLDANIDFDTLSPDEVLLRYFLNLRGLGKQRFIVPVIEYINHHKKAGGATFFQNPRTECYTWCGVNAWSSPDNDELFINYTSHYDARDWAIFQGFIDAKPNKARSIPLKIQVNGTTITLLRMPNGPERADLPPALTDLEGYCPYIDFRDDNNLTLSFLSIPGPQAPRSLQRILFFALKRMNKSTEEAIHIIREAERIIVQKNTAYYEDLLKKLAAFRPSPTTENFAARAQDMAMTQLSLIKNYRMLKPEAIKTPLATNVNTPMEPANDAVKKRA